MLLANFSVLMLGGDARYLEVIKTLSQQGVIVYAIGFEQINFESPHILKADFASVDLQTIDAIILPVAGTNNEGIIETTYANENTYLTRHIIKQTPEHCTIYTGTANSFLINLTESVGRQLITLFSRDDIAILNSIPTAEGTLQIAIEQTDYTIHGSSVIVLGFGRVGMTVARLFDSVGAHVTACVRDSSAAARIREMGLNAIHIDQLADTIHNQAICINTIPHLIIDKAIISKMNPSTLIIDLASIPGGTNIDYARKKGIKTIHALGIPGETAPKTAGNIISEVLYDLMSKQVKV